MIRFSPSYKPALRLAFIWVMFLWVIVALTLDMGEMFSFFLYALAAYVVLLLLVLLRRPSSPTATDLLVIRWSLPFLLMLSALLCPMVWRWRWGWHL